MNQEPSKFDLYIELLTQVKLGNCSYSGLSKCTGLSETILNQTIEPLLHEGLLKKEKIDDAKDDQMSYKITYRGEQFIDFLGTTSNDAELKNHN